MSSSMVEEAICKPFCVMGQPVTSRQIADAIDLLAHTPSAFIAMDLVPAVLPGASFHNKQEALNRLFQRWRKLDLVTFNRGRWRLNRGAWDKMQSAAMRARALTAALVEVRDGE